MNGFEEPDLRATIRRGQLVAVAWHPGLLVRSGPVGDQLRRWRRPGVVIADLTILRDDEGEPDELIVRVLAGRVDHAAQQAIVTWASSLGYRRLWLPDGVIDLPPMPEWVGGRVGTRCPSCHSVWEDDDFSFWCAVRSWGHYPMACPLCGGDLPQWTAARRSR